MQRRRATPRPRPTLGRASYRSSRGRPSMTSSGSTSTAWSNCAPPRRAPRSSYLAPQILLLRLRSPPPPHPAPPPSPHPTDRPAACLLLVALTTSYAPWCGHCKDLKPEYKEVAMQLSEHRPPIPVAMIDATALGTTNYRSIYTDLPHARIN